MSELDCCLEATPVPVQNQTRVKNIQNSVHQLQTINTINDYSKVYGCQKVSKIVHIKRFGK